MFKVSKMALTEDRSRFEAVVQWKSENYMALPFEKELKDTEFVS